MDDKIANRGLSLAMAWGDGWLEPIHQRLHAAYPDLGSDELGAYDTLCRKVMMEGHRRAGPCLRAQDPERFAQLQHEFFQAFRQDYPWVSDDNLARLFSQGCYYAMK